jgi:hypothetical protein
MRLTMLRRVIRILLDSPHYLEMTLNQRNTLVRNLANNAVIIKAIS